MILEVVEADDETVTIRMSIEQGDRHMEGPERESEREPFIELSDPENVTVRKEKATVGDVEIECTVLAVTNRARHRGRAVDQQRGARDRPGEGGAGR